MGEQVARNATGAGGAAVLPASIVDLAPDTAAWDALVARSRPGSYLQTSAWAEVKASNGWVPLRFIGSVIEGEPGSVGPDDLVISSRARAVRAHQAGPSATADESEFGAQLLVRKPRLFPWAFAYAPRGPVFGPGTARLSTLSPSRCAGRRLGTGPRSRTCESSRRSS